MKLEHFLCLDKEKLFSPCDSPFLALGTVVLTCKQGFVSFALHITVELGAEGKWQVHCGGDEFFMPTSSSPLSLDAFG